MNQKMTYVLSYSTGQCDDYSVTVFAVMNDRDRANALCDKFIEIAKLYKNEYSAYTRFQEKMHEARRQALESAKKTFWNGVRAKMPEHLKECIQIYPCSEIEYLTVDFSVEEVPIWE